MREELSGTYRRLFVNLRIKQPIYSRKTCTPSGNMVIDDIITIYRVALKCEYLRANYINNSVINEYITKKTTTYLARKLTC